MERSKGSGRRTRARGAAIVQRERRTIPGMPYVKGRVVGNTVVEHDALAEGIAIDILVHDSERWTLTE